MAERQEGFDTMTAEQYRSLTPTEREVLRRLGAGGRPGEIARDLDRSVSTINNHLHSARAKLAVSDSLSAARALLAFETGGQSVPRQALPGDADRFPAASTDPQPLEAWSPTLLREERARFEHAPPFHDGRIWPSQGGMRDAPTTALRKMAAILCIALLALACVALAPAMAETCQLIVDLLYPLKR